MKRWIAALLTVAMLLGVACFAEDLEIVEEIIVESEDIPVEEIELEFDEVEEMEDILFTDIIDTIDDFPLPEDMMTEDTDISTNAAPASAVSWNGHSYQIFDLDEITTWPAAKAYCESLGGYLATITSAEEDSFVYNNVVLASGYKDAYFGFTDMEEEGTWKWVTGESTDYKNFAPWEPSSGVAENFALYYHKFSNGKWGDGDFRTDTIDNGGKAFICEWGDYSAKPEITYPIVIGNNGETEGTFYESLEQYIMNMDSDKYYPDLAYMLMSLAAAAYNDTGSQGGLLTVENAGYQSESKELYHITKAYEDLGFTDYQPYNYYNDPDDAAYGVDNAAFTIGRKQLSENEALVLIVVRGSYGKIPDLAKGDPLTLTSDWKSNLRIDMDSSGKHYGFATAADKVYSQVMSFLKSRYQNTFIKSNIRYVITGHSRGAAVANLLAVRLHDAGVPDSKVYDYNFACPDTVRGFTLSDLSKDHENIFNVCNSADAVSVIPGVIGDGLDGIIAKFQSLFVSWGKYGTTYFYCKDWNSSKEFDLTRTFDEPTSPHNYKFYVTDMGKKPGGFKTWAQIVKRRVKLGVADGISWIISAFYPSYGAAALDRAKITVEDQVYTGKALKPTVKVVLNKKNLKKGTDYTVTYSNNKKIGTATVTIKGKGNYNGTKTATFKILPEAVSGLKLTAGKWQMTASWKKVSGVTGYQLQYYPKGSSSSAKKVTISSSKTVKKTIKSLKKGRVYYLRIRSYKKVNGSNYYSAWSTKKKVTIK